MNRLYFVAFEIVIYRDQQSPQIARENYQIEYGKPIESLNDVRAIENVIEQKYKADSGNLEDLDVTVTLLNWKRFE